MLLLQIVFRKYRRAKASSQYVKEIERIVQKLKKENKTISSFISEAILGCGGQIIPPKYFFKNSYDLIKKNKGLCIADEVQIDLVAQDLIFWGLRHKSITRHCYNWKIYGNGHPISALITTRNIANSFNNGMEYFNSFGGNPVSCAIGHAVLEILEEELQKNAFSSWKNINGFT